ncbi:hypothetical protein KVG96_03040 [Pseudomonas sp. COR58]|uniref:Uncharacterized protein n=1 Tax=Pseudomonas ekonensis TaxID=2842353 RepID=A0ABS6P8X3_9PSED|nr:hypothetical protein [Pseudomonas ekonensis]MBV4456922.1 hypothetical protein [Pseudomonas ekonensis]
MIKFRNKITNPISVIAIFSFISETSAAVSLPFLDDNEREVYVWFLISFPFYLLLLFFITLNFNYRSLYAPSDFGNDKSFLKAFDPTEPAADETNGTSKAQTTHDPPGTRSLPGPTTLPYVQLPKLMKTLHIVDARELDASEQMATLLENIPHADKPSGRIVLFLVSADPIVTLSSPAPKPLKQPKKMSDRTVCVVYNVCSQELDIVRRV